MKWVTSPFPPLVNRCDGTGEEKKTSTVRLGGSCLFSVRGFHFTSCTPTLLGPTLTPTHPQPTTHPSTTTPVRANTREETKKTSKRFVRNLTLVLQDDHPCLQCKSVNIRCFRIQTSRMWCIFCRKYLFLPSTLHISVKIPPFVSLLQAEQHTCEVT